MNFTLRNYLGWPPPLPLPHTSLLLIMRELILFALRQPPDTVVLPQCIMYMQCDRSNHLDLQNIVAIMKHDMGGGIWLCVDVCV